VIDDPLIHDSVTHLGADAAGRVALCMSHGGRYAGWYGATRRLGALILNDAGIGREQAGLAGIVYLGQLGVAGATLAHTSARIGDGADGAANGIISFANVPAEKLGIRSGMTARAALDILCSADLDSAPMPPSEAEHRHEIGTKVVVMDSVSLVTTEDAGHIIVTASHGGLLGGRPETAVKYPVFAAVFNDADRGIGDAGISRLPALDARDIAGACVSAFSARIGDGISTYDDGYISALNATARRHGGMIGQSCRQFVAAMAAARATRPL
jgi:hypothetical protein